MLPPLVIAFGFEPSISETISVGRPPASVRKAICLPLGDHAGKYSLPTPDVTCHSSPVSRLNRYTSALPKRSDSNVIQFESGDQYGFASLYGLLVSWRSSPVLIV